MRIYELAALLALLPVPALPDALSCPERPVYPDPDFPSVADRVRAARPREVEELDEYAFTLAGTNPERRGIRTDALLVIHHGLVTYERYGRGFVASNRHITWSVTKTLVALLAGAVVGEGALQIDDSICKHLPKVPPERCGITVRHLLEWSSGLDWTESYEASQYQRSSVLAMLYGVGRRDMASFVLEQGSRYEPGTTFRYSTGDAVLLSAVLGAAMEPRRGRDWPFTRFFDRIGMGSAILERDPAGTPVGGSYLYATPRDLAKMGLLLLDDGCFKGARVLPAGWVKDMMSVSEPFRRKEAHRGRGEVAGRSLWLNRPVPDLGIGRPWPDIPEDAAYALGHWGQLVAVIPSLDLIVVRTADDREGRVLDKNRLVRLAIEAGRLP